MSIKKKKISTKSKAESFQRIIVYIKNYFNHHIAATLDSIENEFMLKSDEAETSSKQINDLAKATNIRNNKQKILQNFCDEITHSFSDNRRLLTLDNDDESDLSLMNDSEIQENLIIDNLAYRVNEEYQPTLQAVTKGLMRISNGLKTTPEPTSINPTQIGFTFQRSIKCLKLPFVNLPSVFNTLYNITFTKLDILYGGILYILTESEILNVSENTLPDDYNSYKQFDTGFELVKETSQDFDDDPNDYTISDITASDGTINYELAHLITNAADNASQEKINPIRAADITKEQIENDELAQLLFKKIHGTSKTKDKQANLDTGELLKLFTKLQKDWAGRKITTITNDKSRDVSKQIDATLKALKTALKKDVSITEYNAIQIINRVFIAILDGKLLPETIKIQIKRLQIPYIKAALIDITVLTNKIHPVRLYLDEIALFGIGITEPRHPVIKHISSSIQYLLDNFDSDIKIFKDSYKKLRKTKTIATEKTHIAEHNRLPEVERQARLSHRKHLISNIQRVILRGKLLPENLQALLLRGFARVLIRRCRDHGEESNEFNEIIELFYNVVESLQPTENPDEIFEIQQHAKELVENTYNALSNIFIGFRVSKITKKMEKIYVDQFDAHTEEISMAANKANGNTPPPRVFKTKEDILRILDSKLDKTSDDIITSLPNYIKIDSWFDVYPERNPNPQRVKLVSIIEDTAQLVFFNDLGKRTTVNKISKFLEKIDCERARVLNPNHLFDQALSVAITNMQLSSSNTPNEQTKLK